MKLLAIDHGERRLGLATCDRGGLVAREVTVLTRRSREEDFAAIREHAAREGAGALLVGLPPAPSAAQMATYNWLVRGRRA